MQIDYELSQLAKLVEIDEENMVILKAFMAGHWIQIDV
jgi:hypothetical protein